jgi:hypothetical protein
MNSLCKHAVNSLGFVLLPDMEKAWSSYVGVCMIPDMEKAWSNYVLCQYVEK